MAQDSHLHSPGGHLQVLSQEHETTAGLAQEQLDILVFLLGDWSNVGGPSSFIFLRGFGYKK